MVSTPRATIMEAMRAAIIGGSGVDVTSLLDTVRPRSVDTPFGGVDIETGSFQGQDVGFLRRHGPGHSVPPHRINYRANVWALRQLGVERVLTTAAVGSLREEMGPGHFVIVDQFLDFTKQRASTFHEGGPEGVVHVDVTEPFCPELRELLVSHGTSLDLPVHDGGVYACAEGPRYETAAEVRAFAMLGGDVVGMTVVPEVVLARELGLCYANIASVTNVAAGLSDQPLSHEEVLQAQAGSAERLERLLTAVLGDIPAERTCSCSRKPEAVGE
jgi:5'-methylthioadenosine phosphorylase